MEQTYTGYFSHNIEFSGFSNSPTLLNLVVLKFLTEIIYVNAVSYF